MATLRLATYRASLLATSALRIPRVLAFRQFQLTQIARPSIAAFSTGKRLLGEGLDQLQSSLSIAGAPREFDDADCKTLYVGNLFFDVTHNQLKQHFDAYGTIVNARVVTNSEGRSKGYGFVDFSDYASARAARLATNLSNFAGRRIIVHNAKPMSSGPRVRERVSHPSSTVFVGNLSFDMTDKELNELFRPLKNIRDVRVSVDRHTGRPRGFAHADFLDVDSAVAALQILDGKIIRDRTLRCDYSSSVAARTTLQDSSPYPVKPDTAEKSIASGIQKAKTDADEGSHEPPQKLEDQPEEHQEKDFEQSEEHPTQQLEKEVDKVPEDQAEQKQ